MLGHSHIFALILLAIFQLPGKVMGQSSGTHSDWKTTPNIIVKSFDQDDGLPVVSLSDIVIGADNYLYVASYGGLSRFDGTQFDLITSEQFPQLISNRFIRLLAAPDSSIWMFDEEYRISRWKAGTITTFGAFNGADEQAWRNFKLSPTGNIWAAYRNHLRIFKEGTGFAELPYPSNNAISGFVPDTGAHAWILNKAGLFEYQSEKLLPLISSGNLPFPAYGDTVRISLLSTGKLAIYDYGRVVLYDLKSQKTLSVDLDLPVASLPAVLLEIDASSFIIKTYAKSYTLSYSDTTLQIITPQHSELRPGLAEYKQLLWNGRGLQAGFHKIIYDGYVIYDTSPDIEIKQILQDKEENVWVSTGGQGLVSLSSSPFQLLNTSNGLPGNNVYSIVEEDSQSVWIGGLNSGITRVMRSDIYNWSKNDISPQGGGTVRSLYKTRNGTLLSGYWTEGIKYFKANTWHDMKLDEKGQFSNFTVESYLEDNDGVFWIGTREELLMKPPGSKYFSMALTHDSKSLPMVQVMALDHKDRIWFGTNGSGLYTRKDSLQPIVPVKKIAATSVRDIFTERADTLWLASQNSGLIRAVIDTEGDIKHTHALTKEDGLPDIGVHRILADGYGYFWLPSNRGLSRINETELNAYLDGKESQLWIQTFTEDDGLPIREANGGVQSSGMVGSDGSIWIPTQRGIVWFDPASFLNKNLFESTEIQIAKIETQSKIYHLFGESSLEVAKSDRSVNIWISLLHFSSPENLDVQYRIPSLKTGWQRLSANRQFNIANIPPGTHTIELRLAGVPDVLHAGNSFALTVPSYFYETSWFSVLLAFITLALIAFAFALTVRSAKKRESILNERVNERTHLLEKQKTQTELALSTVQQQASELERLNKVKTDFFINITHELRTPLTLIKGPLGLLKQVSDKRTINREEQLGLIERSSNRLNNLVDRLLHLLRMETEPIMDNVIKIDLGDFVRNRAAQFTSSEGLFGKTFKLNLSAGQVLVDADPYFLESIINNLITNAIKYTNPGDDIEIIAGRAEQEVFLEISDTGIGIAAEDLQHIFDPFYRSVSVQNREGSGIGLSIVKRYMERIGGNIHVESILNQGTTIRLGFPPSGAQNLKDAIYEHKVREPFLENSIITPTKAPYSSPIKQPNNATVLIVDDNEDLRTFFTRLLEDHYSVMTAATGKIALELMATQKPDLILSDVMMPGMDGFELVQTIRSRKQFKLIPIVMLSAKKTDKSIAEGLQAGAQVYLTKPIDNQILLAQIDALLAREERLKELPDRVHKNLNPTQQELVNKIDELILRHLSDPTLSVNSISEALYISYPTLYRKWKKITGGTLNEYILQTRLQETVKLIKEKGCTFTEASGVCGFSDPAYFSKVFKKYYGISPTDYFKE